MQLRLLHALSALGMFSVMMLLRSSSSSRQATLPASDPFPGPVWRVHNENFRTLGATKLFENRWMRVEQHQVEVNSKADDGTVDTKVIGDWIWMDEPGRSRAGGSRATSLLVKLTRLLAQITSTC